MRPALVFALLVSLIGVAVFSGAAALAGDNPLYEHPSSLAAVRARFADPPAAFRPAPLYVWNDDITEDELKRQLDGFAEQGFGGVFIHPRPGLITPYLSERWLELCRFTAEECAKRGLYAHIYDENSYPSGFAGGLVPEQMPDSRQVILRRELFGGDQVASMAIDASTVALFRITGSAPADRFRLVVEPDGRTGSMLAGGGLGARGFRYKGSAFEGAVAFRCIAGRSFVVDDVRLVQADADGRETVIFADDFERASLGPRWVKEGLGDAAAADSLDVSLVDGCLALEHDGSMNDAWLRPDVSVRFEGMTTVFEFSLKARSGDLGGNPALAVGATRFEPGATAGVMLIDVAGAEPLFGHGMSGGVWRTGQAEPLDSADGFARCTYERIDLPALAPGETKTGADLGLAPGTYLCYTTALCGSSPWYGGRWYVDLLRPDVGAKFLDITLGAYDRVLAGEYGRTVLGCFTDEPHTTGGWTARLPERFMAEFGYSLRDHLPSLHIEIGAWRAARHDYAATILTLFLESFARPYFEACEKRGLASTGHVWEHGWPGVGHGSDVMSFNAWQHIPGIDCLMNQYSEGPHAQFGNYRAVKEIRSVANQLGRVRTLCEAYGASGWDVSFQDLKRIGDWLCIGGVNLLNPHLSYYTIRGARKADHPPSFSYHEPWWEAHHLLGDYFGRLCWVLAAGEERNDILVIEPTTTMWMYNFSPSTGRRLEELGSAFQRYVTELGDAQIGFDLGSEPVMAGRSRVEGGRLVVGQRSYGVVVLPPGLENLETPTLKLLEELAAEGGRIISYAGAPAFVGAWEDPRPAALRKAAGPCWIDAAEPYGAAERELVEPPIAVAAEAPEGARVFHHLRELDEGRFLCLVNTSLDAEAPCTVSAAGRHVERWDLATGGIEPVACELAGALAGSAAATPRLEWSVRLPPAGSALFAIWDERETGDAAGGADDGAATVCPAAGELKVERLDPNVLILDFMDLAAGGERAFGLYRYEAQTRAYKAHGFDRNPWDRAVQFADELIRKDVFAPDSGFELAYRFLIGGFDAMPQLDLVVERGDRYRVEVNGCPAPPAAGRWWLDRSFTVHTIDPAWLKPGENVIACTAQPFSIHHEPEPVYLLGDFALRSAAQGWIIEPPRLLGLGAWSQQGCPFYAGRVAYTQSFTAAERPRSCFVELPSLPAVAARVDVNGAKAGYIGWQPWRIDVTAAAPSGENAVTVTLFGSLKNLLGPHHRGRVRGSAWPDAFYHSMPPGPPAGEAYDVIEYGLDQPFRLLAK